MHHQIHPNKIRQVLFLAVVILLGIVIAKEMYFMLGAFLGAITLYVLLRGMMIKLIIHKQWPKWLSALLLMLASIVVLIIPVAWMTSVLIEKVKPIIEQPQILNSTFEKINTYLSTEFDVNILHVDNINKINGMILPAVQKTLGSTLAGLGNIFIMYLILFFLLINTTKVELWMRKQIPFKKGNVQRTISEIRNMVYSNAVAIPLVALLQGLVGMLGYWIFGIEEFILMGMLTAICSVIPAVGSMIIYIPLAVYQLSLGHTTSGIAVAIWGFVLIGSVDNIARFMLQKRMANIHPLITLFGVFVGLNMFGFLGIIFGPLLLSLFILLVKIYVDEFGIADADIISEKHSNLV